VGGFFAKFGTYSSSYLSLLLVSGNGCLFWGTNPIGVGGVWRSLKNVGGWGLLETHKRLCFIGGCFFWKLDSG